MFSYFSSYTLEQSYNSSGFVVVLFDFVFCFYLCFFVFISDNSLHNITDKLTFHDT